MDRSAGKWRCIRGSRGPDADRGSFGDGSRGYPGQGRAAGSLLPKDWRFWIDDMRFCGERLAQRGKAAAGSARVTSAAPQCRRGRGAGRGGSGEGGERARGGITRAQRGGRTCEGSKKRKE